MPYIQPSIIVYMGTIEIKLAQSNKTNSSWGTLIRCQQRVAKTLKEKANQTLSKNLHGIEERERKIKQEVHPNFIVQASDQELHGVPWLDSWIAIATDLFGLNTSPVSS